MLTNTLSVGNLFLRKSRISLSAVYGHDLLTHVINMKEKGPYPLVYNVKSAKSTI